MSDDPKNPSFVPKAESHRLRACQKCNSKDYGGRRIQGGTIVFTCRVCKNTWTGGLPQVPVDPRAPLLPLSPRDIPTVVYDPYVDPKTKEIKFREETRPPDVSQSFRRGAPVPDGEEN